MNSHDVVFLTATALIFMYAGRESFHSFHKIRAEFRIRRSVGCRWKDWMAFIWFMLIGLGPMLYYGLNLLSDLGFA
jgi:hypothetical protein